MTELSEELLLYYNNNIIHEKPLIKKYYNKAVCNVRKIVLIKEGNHLLHLNNLINGNKIKNIDELYRLLSNDKNIKLEFF